MASTNWWIPQSPPILVAELWGALLALCPTPHNHSLLIQKLLGFTFLHLNWGENSSYYRELRKISRAYFSLLVTFRAEFKKRKISYKRLCDALWIYPGMVVYLQILEWVYFPNKGLGVSNFSHWVMDWLLVLKTKGCFLLNGGLELLSNSSKVKGCWVLLT